MYVCVCVCARARARVRACVCTGLYACRARVCVCVHAHVSVFVYVCRRAGASVCVRVRECLCISIFESVYVSISFVWSLTLLSQPVKKTKNIPSARNPHFCSLCLQSTSSPQLIQGFRHAQGSKEKILISVSRFVLLSPSSYVTSLR